MQILPIIAQLSRMADLLTQGIFIRFLRPSEIITLLFIEPSYSPIQLSIPRVILPFCFSQFFHTRT